MKTVAIVSTGVIGASWAALFLAKGWRVVATDPGHGAEAKLREVVSAHWPGLEHMGLAPGAHQNNLVWASSIEEACAGADFVQESGPERVDIKTEMYARIDAATPISTIIASSSSGLGSSQYISGCSVNPGRILVAHPINPPHLVPLVEVCPGPHTLTTYVTAAMALYESLDRTPILVKQELVGFVANRLQAALWQEAFSLIVRGICSAEDVDKAISHGPGLRWAFLGPVLNMHISGGDLGLAHVLDHLGPPIESFWADLGKLELNTENKAKIVASCNEALAKLDWEKTVAQRDIALVNLLNDKKEKTHLP